MYCNATSDLIYQSPIQFGQNIYSCNNESQVVINCPIGKLNSPIVDSCAESNKTIPCGVNVDEKEPLLCKSGTLMSSSSVVCSSTKDVSGLSPNGTVTVLQCEMKELLPPAAAARIPTTTQPPPAEKTEDDLSFMAKVHLFFLRLVGKGPEKVTTSAPEVTTLPPDAWVPLPLTVPPEPLENVTLPALPTNETTTMKISETLLTSTEATKISEKLLTTTEAAKTDDKATTAKSSTTLNVEDVEDDYFEDGVKGEKKE